MFSSLIERIKDLDRGALIVIEGACGSGKTTIAQKLSKELKIQFIDTDYYIIKQSDSNHYVSLLDVEHLNEVISTFAKREKKLIFSGICAQQILQQLSISPTFKVYIKPVASNNTWHYGLHLEDAIENSSNLPNQQPHQSDMQYHLEFKPHENTDFIFEYMRD